jgi:shikimate kinase
VLRAENREAIREMGRPVVWLTAPADVVRQRLAADPTTAERRPALAVPPSGMPSASGDPLAEVTAALADREPLYHACADAHFDTSTAMPAAVAAQITAWLRTEWSTRTGNAARGDGHPAEGRSGAAS